MSVLLAIQICLRWMHIFGSTILVGGILYQCLAVPAVAEAVGRDGTSGSGSLAEKGVAKWRVLVMISITMLLISGFANSFLILSRSRLATTFPATAYHELLGIKFMLAMCVFYLSSRLAGRRLVKSPRKGLVLNALLASLVVLLAGMMKLADRQVKAPAAPGQAPSVVSINSR
jgi:hypothetical protein